jgi:hypothetical protein
VGDDAEYLAQRIKTYAQQSPAEIETSAANANTITARRD